MTITKEEIEAWRDALTDCECGFCSSCDCGYRKSRLTWCLDALESLQEQLRLANLDQLTADAENSELLQKIESQQKELEKL